VLITRTPLRITLGGGGTDLPSYFRQRPGFVISAAIDKYVFIGINRTFTEDFFLKYSALERVERPGEIEHPIIRAALESHPVEPGVEIVSLADIPAGTGLGSSGTFTVGLLRALYAWQREHVSAAELAEEACRIEIDVLGRPVGKQDQYIAAFGGVSCFRFEPDGSVGVAPLELPTATMHELEERLLMFFTGSSRTADELLDDQRKRTEAGDESMLAGLKRVEDLGAMIRDALVAGDVARFGELMHEHWAEKRERSPGMSNPDIDRWYEAGRANGAVGGKLTGAGGGGFLLFLADDPAALRAAMEAEGLAEVRFGFDHDGSTIVVRA
jgi:D-glycero-alpha-D-manno-heptose-7-phosphate kinase